MATAWSSDHGYEAAKTVRRAGTKLEVRGATYAHREWLTQQGFGYVGKTQTWKALMPTNNAATASLLWELRSRGMEWRAVSR